MQAMELGRAEWLQMAGQRLDVSSYILRQQGLQGLPVVFFKKGYLAQQEELGMSDEPVQWQTNTQASAYAAPIRLEDTEFCIIGATEYRVRAAELGRGKRRRASPTEPYLRLLLLRQSMPAGRELGLWVEHRVHLSLPDFIISRARFEGSVSAPFLPLQRVKMLWKDAADPAKGQWYEGSILHEGQQFGPESGATWEGVSVQWDTDGSITHVSPWELVRMPQQSQQQQQQQPHWSVPGLHNPMHALLTSPHGDLQQQGRSVAPHMPLFHPGPSRLEEQRLVPTVGEHPVHLPRLQLRPGLHVAGKGPGMGPGAGVSHRAASGTSLADPGSGVSADTPGTLPWGQPGAVSQPDRLNGGETTVQAQLKLRHGIPSHSYAAEKRPVLPLTLTSPQAHPLSLSPSDIPPLFTGQRSDSLSALRGSATWGLLSGQSLDAGIGQEEERRLGMVQEEKQKIGIGQPQWGRGDGVEGYAGVESVCGKAGDRVYMAILKEDNSVQHTLGVFATALDAARAYDAAALRLYGQDAESMLNFPSANYPDVLAELRSWRRTNSTDDMDTPASMADSPLWEMRSQSLTALGIAMSPHAQRQMIASSPGKRQTPAKSVGAKHRPMPSSHVSTSKLAAMASHISVPDERESPVKSHGGKHRLAPTKASRQSPSRLAAAVGSIPMIDEPSETDKPDIARTHSGARTRSQQRQGSAASADAVHFDEDEEEEQEEGADGSEEAQDPPQAALRRRSLRSRTHSRKRTTKLQRPGSGDPDEEEARQGVLEGGEDEWAPSPAA